MTSGLLTWTASTLTLWTQTAGTMRWTLTTSSETHSEGMGVRDSNRSRAPQGS